jgi:aldose 1-epimerase
VRNGAFTFEGKSYRLPINNGPNAIHGFAIDAPWQVLEHKAGSNSAYIEGRYQISQESPEMLPNWPSDAVLQVRYELAGRRLTMTVTVSNPTAANLPYGFGIHPYFHFPFFPGGRPEQTRVIVPASRFWVLHDFLPTGEIRPVDARLDFRAGQPCSGLKLDDVLTDLEYEADRCTCRLVDLDRRSAFQLGFDRGCREVVLYTPPRPDVICLEPYTQTTDAINLQAKGVSAGLRVLGHGGKDTFVITMETLET